MPLQIADLQTYAAEEVERELDGRASFLFQLIGLPADLARSCHRQVVALQYRTNVHDGINHIAQRILDKY